MGGFFYCQPCLEEVDVLRMLVGAAPGAQRLSKVVVHTALLCKYRKKVTTIEQQRKYKKKSGLLASTKWWMARKNYRWPTKERVAIQRKVALTRKSGFKKRWVAKAVFRIRWIHN